MQIRKLAHADAPTYRNFRLRGLREHADAFTSSYEEASLKSLADSEKRLAPDSGEVIWAAFEDDQMVGMAGLARETRLKNRHKAILTGMYVSPGFSGRGIGRALVETVLREARSSGIELIVLTVTEGNLEAVSLYEKCGFKTFGIEPDAIRVNNISHGKQHMYFQIAPL